MNAAKQLEEGVNAYLEQRYADAEAIASTLIAADPSDYRALNLLGMVLCRQGRAVDGLRYVERALEICPSYEAAYSNLAMLLRERGELSAANACLDRACAQMPEAIDVRILKASWLLESGESRAAIALLDECLARGRESVELLAVHGDALFAAGRFNEALASYERALALVPQMPETLNNRGNALRALNRPQEAVDSYRRAIELNPRLSEAHNNLGNALTDLKHMDEALVCFEHALALKPEYPEALNNCGLVLAGLGRFDEAFACYDRAIAINPAYVDAYNSRGILFGELRQHERALADFDAAIALRPDYALAWSNRGNTLRQLKRLEDAIASFDRALALDPSLPEASYSQGHVLRDLKKYAKSVIAYANLLEHAPEYPFAKGHFLHAKMMCCDWSNVEALIRAIKKEVRAGLPSAEPFGYQGVADSVHDLRACAEIYAQAMYPSRAAGYLARARTVSSKLRLGYLCGEFRQQATSVLMVELFERHDKSRFELVAFDNGWDDRSPMRARIERAFDEIVDISQMGDRQAAEAIHQRGIDILVNLNGYFGLQRQGVFALKPAPLQVNYLGFPGTLGARYMDYILADRCVIPPDERDAYVEQVVYLPDCYQANDSKRPIAAHSGSRSDHGLPERSFVFCCFNNNYKITPEIFGIWMRLLERIAGSVLWLLEDNADAARNLRKEAARRGIDPRRLVFAPRMTAAEHLARHRHADLFLDTLPYNAHTTASDALWAGLPLLTCRGTTFPGRVAASLLQAAGMPELITESLADYERMAVTLATEPTRLAELRARLAGNRSTCRLYDSDRFRRHIEAAYQAMWQRMLRGEMPQGYEVPSEP